MTSWNGYNFHFPSRFLIESIVSMHDYVIIFLFSILIFVVFILSLSLFFPDFNLEFSENHQLENVWTLLPFFILFLIALPSLSSLYILDTCFFCGTTIRIIGHQWYWSYFLKDFFSCSFDSYIEPRDTTSIRLLDVDNRLLLPCRLPLRFLVSSADVIHSWTIPSFGLKIDAIPGRINQFCFSSKRSGIFFGQCSEICGANHSFMPIVLEIVPFKKFLSILS